MGAKTKNLEALKNRRINVHDFKEIVVQNENQAIIELGKYAQQHKVFTIRGDSEPLKFCLPFLAIDKDFFYMKSQVQEFIRQCVDTECSMLVSDGKKFDDIQTANVVVVLEGNTIKIEVSGEKIPLRHMYRHPNNITTYSGDIQQCVRNFKRYGAVPTLSSSELERILNLVFSIKQQNERHFELTVYPEKVGIYHSEIIFWQIY